MKTKDELTRENLKLKRLLRENQWEGCLCSYPDEKGCPECGGHYYDKQKHHDHCEIGKVLRP